MTEEEAKTKWCFAAVASHTDPRGGFRQDEGEHPHTSKQFPCIGSACMAWRGKESHAFQMKAAAEFRRTGMRLVAGPTDMEGFCGLAGSPQ